MLSDRELLATVQDAADDYTVFGELGRRGDALAALLARDRATGHLVVLMVSAASDAAGALELSIDVKEQLDARIPDGGTKCPACGATLRPWVRFCTQCGHDVTGQGAVSPEERAALRDAVQTAVATDYEYLGEIRRSEGGGDVFFARERSSGRIAAMRLNQSHADGEYELGETNILRKAPAPAAQRAPLVSVTQILRKLDPDTGSATANAPFPPRENRPAARPAAPSLPAPAAPPPTGAPPRTAPPGTEADAHSGYHLPLSLRTLSIAAVVLVAVVAILAVLVMQ